jgi:predicted transcriptional regulator of viral defense system
MPRSVREGIVSRASRGAVVTAREATSAGVHSQELTRLVATGRLERVARGQYRAPDQPITEHHALALVARAVPRGVICLLSALGYHGIGTQLPPDVWVAVERGKRPPRLAYPPLRVVTFSGAAFTVGIETRVIEGQRVRIYSVAKTIADLFKARNRVGLDVAIEALREAWRERRFTMSDLERHARTCRVHRVMRPYLEMLAA